MYFHSIPFHFQVDHANESLTVDWSDGHLSRYDLSWLWDHRLRSEVQEQWAEDCYHSQLYPQKLKEYKTLSFKDVSQTSFFSHQKSLFRSYANLQESHWPSQDAIVRERPLVADLELTCS